jgi:hypothetical protein
MMLKQILSNHGNVAKADPEKGEHVTLEGDTTQSLPVVTEHVELGERRDDLPPARSINPGRRV